MNRWPLPRLKYVRARLEDAITELERPAPDMSMVLERVWLAHAAAGELATIADELRRKVPPHDAPESTHSKG